MTTIASAFAEVTKSVTGSAPAEPTIAGQVNALADALGSEAPAGKTIASAVQRLDGVIGSGGGGESGGIVVGDVNCALVLKINNVEFTQYDSQLINPSNNGPIMATNAKMNYFKSGLDYKITITDYRYATESFGTKVEEAAVAQGINVTTELVEDDYNYLFITWHTDVDPEYDSWGVWTVTLNITV